MAATTTDEKTASDDGKPDEAEPVGDAVPARAFRKILVRLGIQPLATAQDATVDAAFPSATCAPVNATGDPASPSSTPASSSDDIKAQRLANERRTVRGPPLPGTTPSSPGASGAAAPAATGAAGVAAVSIVTGSFTVPVPVLDATIPADTDVPAGPAARSDAARAPPIA